MDPGFLFTTSQVLQQAMATRSMAARLDQIEKEKQRLEDQKKQRRSMLVSAGKDGDTLLQLLSTQPAQVLVHATWILHSLDGMQVIPDSFEDLKEKEDCALVWRKTINIAEKARALLSPEQIIQCDQCLKAWSIQNLIRLTADRLDFYHAHEQIQSKLARAAERNHQVDIGRNFIWAGILVAAGIAAFISVSDFGAQAAPGILVLIALFFFAAVALVSIFVDLLRPKEIQLLEKRAQTYAIQACLADEQFWQTVREYFGRIPTSPDLQTAWREQEGFIKMIFPDPMTVSEEKIKPD